MRITTNVVASPPTTHIRMYAHVLTHFAGLGRLRVDDHNTVDCVGFLR